MDVVTKVDLIFAVAFLSMVILFREEIRRYIVALFRAVAVFSTIYFLWSWSGVRLDILHSGPVLVALVVIGAALAWLSELKLPSTTPPNQNPPPIEDLSDLPGPTKGAQLRWEHERGLINDDEYQKQRAASQIGTEPPSD